ncbi:MULTISPECIES: hypothetical protein [unclassified Massilia]|uniref:head-tail joining protein n=1 Tax=unclassified Massilia TaxID=2609279 RepID=UPI00177DB2C0|nr:MULTISPECIES: hypothetical protein [unclassified Massilia]MBD8531486.1 hypothetical protein [Massilia sp. CFBP 13647]MBD8673718.1 hypothetical protein [Massilia sp. CFBP 13721]
MNFAAIEAVTNAAIMRHLANAEVRIAGTVVPGIFQCPSVVVGGGPGAADTSPTVKVASAGLPANLVDELIEINGVPYVIVLPAPDGTGMTILTVECAQ